MGLERHTTKKKKKKKKLKQQLFRHFLKNQLNCRWANYELTIVSVNLKENGQREREREKQ